jgi:hypothetical protein
VGRCPIKCKLKDLEWLEIHLLTVSQRGDLASARALPFEASAHYEDSLSYFPDHPASTIALSSLLLDIYTEAMPAEPPQPFLPTQHSAGALASNTLNQTTSSTTTPIAPPSSTTTPPAPAPKLAPGISTTTRKSPSPAELNRLAARERAYMLLSGLTRLGVGWDDSEAWLALARAHELGGQVGKAKAALWWVGELEESRMIRGWAEVAVGGLAL